MDTATDAHQPPSIWSDILDSKARETPDKVWCQILEDDWLERGARDITWAQAARAVNRLCWWLQDEFGPSDHYDAFAYVGHNDVRYTFLAMASQKSQRKVSVRR